jgi:hypothetical protein
VVPPPQAFGLPGLRKLIAQAKLATAIADESDAACGGASGRRRAASVRALGRGAWSELHDVIKKATTTKFVTAPVFDLIRPMPSADHLPMPLSQAGALPAPQLNEQQPTVLTPLSARLRR